jgi:hypothetical protein
VSLNRAEEDGVDNRVEAPRTAGGNPAGLAAGQGASEDAGETQVLGGRNGSAPAAPLPAPGMAAAPAAAAYPGGQPYSPLMAPGSAPDGGSALTETAAQAVASAASGARNVAAKIGASFSGISWPRPTRQASERAMPSAGPQAPPAPPQVPPGPQAGPAAPPRVQFQAGTGRPRRRRDWRAAAGPAPRSALLSLQRVEPLSVMKFSFMISLVGWVVVFVAVAVIYYVLSKLGVFTQIEQTVGLVTYSKSHPGTNASSWFRASRVLGWTAIICTINAILFTALATIGAALYNLITTISGGVEVTLKETD